MHRQQDRNDNDLANENENEMRVTWTPTSWSLTSFQLVQLLQRNQTMGKKLLGTAFKLRNVCLRSPYIKRLRIWSFHSIVFLETTNKYTKLTLAFEQLGPWWFGHIKTNCTIWKISRTFLVTWSVFTEDVILSVDAVAFLVENSYLQVTKCSQTNQMESINTKWIERQPQLCQFCTFCSLRFGFIVTFARNLVYLGIVWKSRSDLHHSRGLITTWVESGFGG